MRRFPVIFILLLLSLSIQSQTFDYNQRCIEAYESISELKFNTARSLIYAESRENPENLYTLYLENYIDFLTLVIGEDEDSLHILEERKNQRLAQIEKGPEDSPYYRYCKAGINLQWAFSRIKFEEYFTAFLEIRRALKLLEENQKMFPDFLPNYPGLGLLHILIGSIPDKYKWLGGLFGLEGDVNTGMAELRYALHQALKNSEFQVYATESLFFLSFIQVNLMPGQSGMIEIEEMLDTVSINSPLIIFARAGFYQKTGQNEKALMALADRNKINNSYPFYYLDYLTGLSHLYKLDPRSRDYFEDYIEEFRGRSYVASAYQKIAWSYLIAYDTLLYHRNMQKIKLVPESFVGADEVARNEAADDEIPNIILLKARLLSDGGYYQEALGLLDDSVNLYNMQLKEKTEYFYRKGRIFQKMNNYSAALGNFKKCIDLGKNLKKYYAAAAALQSAIIYEELNNIEMAEDYYRYCIGLDFDEYERSIKHKAKARLNAMK